VHLLSLRLPPTTMLSVNARQPRKGCSYTPDERKVLNIYKEEYRIQTTSKCRGNIFRTKILPAIFNYWTDDGAVPITRDEEANRVEVCGVEGYLPLPMLLHQALAGWVRNNWRPYATVKAAKSGKRYTKIDAVWGTEKEAVEIELKAMLGVDQLDPSSQDYFQQRTAAIKHVYDRMDECGKKKIDDEVKRGRTEANKPEVQQK
jgi:hypothetical protein